MILTKDNYAQEEVFQDLEVEINCSGSDVWNAQPHVVNFNRLDSTCGLNFLQELSWRVNEIMPNICVVSLTWCFSSLLVPWPATLCMRTCVNVASSPFLMLCWGIHWQMNDPPRAIAWISAMSSLFHFLLCMVILS